MLSSVTPRHWLTIAIVLTVVGVLLGIGGCVIAAVGFGLSAKDMYDYPNLAMRVAGTLMVASSFLPSAVSACCWVFYCQSKNEAKKGARNPQAYVISSQNEMQMKQYPYSTSAMTDTRIYKPQQPPRYGNVDADDSLAPLNYSDSTSRYPPDTSSPQVVTSGSSFDDDSTAAKVRQPKKTKKTRKGPGASVDEKETMVSGYSSASAGFRT